jgi:hypothetical protein
LLDCTASTGRLLHVCFRRSSNINSPSQALLVIVPQSIVDKLKAKYSHEKVESSTAHHEPSHNFNVMQRKAKASVLRVATRRSIILFKAQGTNKRVKKTTSDPNAHNLGLSHKLGPFHLVKNDQDTESNYVYSQNILNRTNLLKDNTNELTHGHVACGKSRHNRYQYKEFVKHVSRRVGLFLKLCLELCTTLLHRDLFLSSGPVLDYCSVLGLSAECSKVGTM